MFLNNSWISLEFLKTFIKVYVRQVFVNVRSEEVLFFPDIMSDRFWKIIFSPVVDVDIFIYSLVYSAITVHNAATVIFCQRSIFIFHKLPSTFQYVKDCNWLNYNSFLSQFCKNVDRKTEISQQWQCGTLNSPRSVLKNSSEEVYTCTTETAHLPSNNHFTKDVNQFTEHVNLTALSSNKNTFITKHLKRATFVGWEAPTHKDI